MNYQMPRSQHFMNGFNQLKNDLLQIYPISNHTKTEDDRRVHGGGRGRAALETWGLDSGSERSL